MTQPHPFSTLGARSDPGAPATPRPRRASEVLSYLSQLINAGDVGSMTALPTGFDPLDSYLDGGIRPGELVLVGGPQGSGKTVFTVQMARNLALTSGATCGYVCFEHDEASMMQRLISLESLASSGWNEEASLPLSKLRSLLAAAGRGYGDRRPIEIESALAGQPGAAAALDRVQDYGQRLYFLRGSISATDVVGLRRLCREWKDRHGPRVALFVDYVQKLPVFPLASNDGERVTRLAYTLKEVALSESIPIVGVVIADIAGLQAQRLRLHHIQGSSALMYESDVVIILNNKYRIVTKRNITFNPYRAQEFRNWVICSLEKNRSGHDLVDLEFRARFDFAAIDPQGRLASDQLIDERIDEG